MYYTNDLGSRGALGNCLTLFQRSGGGLQGRTMLDMTTNIRSQH
jgi:hypothetical protein